MVTANTPMANERYETLIIGVDSRMGNGLFEIYEKRKTPEGMYEFRSTVLRKNSGEVVNEYVSEKINDSRAKGLTCLLFDFNSGGQA